MCQNCKQNVKSTLQCIVTMDPSICILVLSVQISMLHIVKSSLCSSRLLLLYALSSFWRQTSWIYCLQSLLSGIQFKLQILLFFGASFFLFKYDFFPAQVFPSSNMTCQLKFRFQSRSLHPITSQTIRLQPSI